MIAGALVLELAIPALPGARCRGRHELFDAPPAGADPDIAAYRQAAALAECRRCPALAACAAWVDALPLGQRPLGVIAGRVHAPPPRGRPPKAAR